MNHEIKLWHVKADNDLKVGTHEVEHDDPTIDIICFHAQQAAEKYLKSYLLSQGVTPDKTHNLDVLIRKCLACDPSFIALREKDVSALTIYAVEGRYPDECYSPSLEEAKDALGKALFVKQFVLERLAAAGYNDK